MRVLAIILGFAGIWVVGQEAFETVVLPRRVTRRLRFTQIFYSVVRTAWKAFRLVPPGPRRESYLRLLRPAFSAGPVRLLGRALCSRIWDAALGIGGPPGCPRRG